MPVDRRLVESAELQSFVVDGCLLSDEEIACADPAYGPVCTTTKEYWGIETVSDWLAWVRHEMDFTVWDEQVPDNLGLMREKGWTSSADMILQTRETYAAIGMPRPTKRQPAQADEDMKEITEKMNILAADGGQPAQGQSAAPGASGAECSSGERVRSTKSAHNNLMEVPIATLRDEQVYANVVETAARHLGKNTNGAEIFMTELERDKNNAEYRIGYYPYPKTGNTKLPGTDLGFGLILYGRNSDFEQEDLAARMIDVMGSIHDTMDSRYEWRPTMIKLRRPHVRYHVCECCQGPAFNGPHVDPRIRRSTLPPRKLK
ncbi:hypothetical protein HDU87_005292 [Geranomyces variabilis]|uniref:Uncharacterized protein n=1 Tax=Geranomyces variabilis TaxID=109894 RepID=A0AAD5THM3_9FUNG|nr:hypothetical protein HDU87_005292 [Geranomyces variabilis]